MMCAPDGSSFNFSDTGHKLVANPAMLWFFSKLNDLSVLWIEKELMANKRPSFGEVFYETASGFVTLHKTIYGVLIA